MNNIIAGVDLGKNAIQVCLVKAKKVLSNQEMSPDEFLVWLARSQTMTIIFETCTTSNYWKQVAEQNGHVSKLISAQLVSQIRQNQKTDKNDALAIVQASELTNIRFAKGKTRDQQELQSLLRMREQAIKHKVALRNQLEGLLLEFNIRIKRQQGGLRGCIEATLEESENGLSMLLRQALHVQWQLYLSVQNAICELDRQMESAVKNNDMCQRFLALEGVSFINAINLYVCLGSNELGTFKRGSDAAACIGLTPIQHSSGGKTKVGSIGKYVRNKSVRSYLISGAMSFIVSLQRRSPRTEKEQWLQELVERRGKKCAAVALANKTVRTAFAMLQNNTSYKAVPLIG